MTKKRYDCQNALHDFYAKLRKLGDDAWQLCRLIGMLFFMGIIPGMAVCVGFGWFEQSSPLTTLIYAAIGDVTIVIVIAVCYFVYWTVRGVFYDIPFRIAAWIDDRRARRDQDQDWTVVEE